LQGAWRHVLDFVRDYRTADPEHYLSYAAYCVLAFVKLRDFNAAAAEVKHVYDAKGGSF
jgi:hypothetical protein